MTGPIPTHRAKTGAIWVNGLCTYLIVITVGNLVWEMLQLPLYTIWSTGTLRQQAYAILHCTLGDIIIALTALGLALVTLGNANWPASRSPQVSGLALICGLGYTIFSEWLNISVRSAWAYSDRMPIIPIGELRVGLAPLLQWIIVPAVGFAFAWGTTFPGVRRAE